MDWGSIIAAGIGAGAGLLGSNQEHIGPGDVMPNWIEGDWRQLGGQIAGLQQPKYYPGKSLAPFTPLQRQAMGGINQYSSPGGFGFQTQYEMNKVGDRGRAAQQRGLNFTNYLGKRGANKFAFPQTTFNAAFSNLMPGLQGSYDAATRDINRDLNWNQLPGINMANVAAGGMGNTKALQGSALAQGMAQDRAADVGAGLYMNAANQALGLAGRAGLANQASANQLDSSRLGAYQGFAGLGLPYLDQSYNTGMQNLRNRLFVGDLQQGQQQRNIDANMNRWNFNQNIPMQHLQNQLNMVMGTVPNSGQIGTTTGMSPFQGAVQGLQAGMGLYGMGQENGWWGSSLNPVTPPPGNYNPQNYQNIYNPTPGVNWGMYT